MNYTHLRMSPKLEVRHLKLLVTVAEEGSVTEAGKRLHLTQSALSHQLRDAEEKLGTALFLRLGRKMVLTPAGERLIACARRVLDELSDTEVQIEGLNGGARGEIRLSTECYTCYHWLPPVLQKFTESFRKSKSISWPVRPRIRRLHCSKASWMSRSSALSCVTRACA